MNHDDFIGQVTHRARLDSRGAAERAVRAVLETLAERLPADEAHHVASQLPQELGLHIERSKGGTERFGPDEFYRRVSAKEEVEAADAAFHARCVLEVLQEALSEGQVRQLRAMLPEDYDAVFDAGSEGRHEATSS